MPTRPFIDFGNAAHDLFATWEMVRNDRRYCHLHDGSVRRNPSKKPLLHNGGKP